MKEIPKASQMYRVLCKEAHENFADDIKLWDSGKWPTFKMVEGKNSKRKVSAQGDKEKSSGEEQENRI